MDMHQSRCAAIGPTTRPLAGKGAIVTGSTSGIGLGIARALAAAGADLMLNGFGEAAAIATPARRARDRVRRHRGAQRRRHEPARADREHGGRGRGDARRGRHPGQQCRHPARGADRGVPAGEVGRDPGDQSLGRVPHHARRDPRDDGARLGPDRQCRLGARPGRLALQVGLRRGQARAGRPDQGRRAGARRDRRHLQRGLPGLCLDAAGRAADRRPGQIARHRRASRSSATCC